MSYSIPDSHNSSLKGGEGERWAGICGHGIGLCWAQIRNIFHDLQMAIYDPFLSTSVEGKERVRYSMLALRL